MLGDIGSAGAHLVRGSAGSGKTSLLVDRATALLADDQTGLLVLVRNRRTARQVADRIVRAHGRATAEARVMTWHGFARAVLQPPDADPIALLTAPEQFALVRELLDLEIAEGGWEAFPKQRHLTGFAGELREFVLRAQDAFVSPEELATLAMERARPDLGEAARFFRRYLDHLDAQTPQVRDHANVIAQAVLKLREDATLLQKIQPPVKHVLVDDLQDATPAQLALLAEIAGAATSVIATVDADSRIYGYRGAAADVDAEFQRLLKPATVHTLDVPHRTPARREAWLFEHGADEANAIARECRRLHAQDGVGYGDIAIVVRRLGSGERAIARALDALDVPSVVVGGNRALRSEPALRPLFLLADAARATDDRDAALLAVMGTPAGGLDPYEVRALRREARVRTLSIAELVDGAPSDLPGLLADKISRLRAWLDLATEALTKNPSEGFFALWENLPYVHEMIASEDAIGLDAATALSRALERFAERKPDATFAGYIDLVADVEFGPEPWQMPEESRPDAVRILTAHATAGTEFDTVIVAGCVEGAFPAADGRRALLDVRDLLTASDAPPPRAERGAEERRLFGVATTRARSTLIVTAARRVSSGDLAVPSPLIEQIGLAWGAPSAEREPVTRGEAEAHARRVLVNTDATDDARKQALDTLARLPGVDPDTWWFERERTVNDAPLYGEEFLASYSRLAPYENCGLSYLYGREMGLDPTSTHAMRVGSMVHEIFEIASKNEIERTKEAMTAALDERWDASIFPSVAVEHRVRKDCEQMIDRWIHADGGVDPLAVEVEFAFDVEGATIRGYIDRVVRCGGKSTRVIDYKTGRSTKSDAECVEDLQLATYYLALTRDPNLAELGEPMRMELAFIASNYWKSRPGVDPRRIPNYAENAVERIEALVAGIRSEDFSPREEADCQWCSFKPLCPLWPEGQEVTL